jgi:Druantia protein DruA/DDE_Tnp_1-associated
MKRTSAPSLTADEQTVLDQVEVRLIEPEERLRFDQLLVAEHYLHAADLVGEQLRYVAVVRGQWVALLAWNAPAFCLRDREQWIGWTTAQKRRRLSLVANNSRFLVLPDRSVPNLASRVMKLCLQRLATDWQQAYGHPVLVAESFVDRQLFRGTCYKASGWTLLGQTQGYRRTRQDYYLAHDRPKQLWVKELQPGVRTLLRGRNLPSALQPVARYQPPECHQTPVELEQMRGFFADLPDWRARRCPYAVSTLVTVAVCAMLSGVCLGQRDLTAFAAGLTPAQMTALKFPRRGRPCRHQVPGETTFFRLLTHLDSRALEAALLDWQNHVLGPRPAEDDQVAVDGKELLNSQGQQIVSAYTVKGGRWLGSEPVAPGSNEIPAAQTLLRRAPIEGMLVTADALHTQSETARIIGQEKGADYLLTVKGNQQQIAANVRQLHQGLTHAFPPSAPDAHRTNA